MKAVINCFVKNDLSIYNGLTFDVVGHCNGCIEVDINGIINDMQLTEIIIVDITKEITHSIIRHDKMFFDYWYDILKMYCKVNKIKIKPEKLPTEKAERMEVIFNDNPQSDNDLFKTYGRGIFIEGETEIAPNTEQ
jgi:hypothetical protein